MNSFFRGPFLFILAMLSLTAGWAHSASILIAERSQEFINGELSVIDSGTFELYISAQDEMGNPTGPSTTLSAEFSEADSGMTFTFFPHQIFDGTEGYSPDFNAMSLLMTNGVDDYIEVFFEGALIIRDESTFWTSYDLGGAGNPDFAGMSIDYLTVTVNNLQLDSPGLDPNGDGNWTSFTFDYSLRVYGIPEPGSAFLGACGLLLVLVRRRRRTKGLRSL